MGQAATGRQLILLQVDALVRISWCGIVAGDFRRRRACRKQLRSPSLKVLVDQDGAVLLLEYGIVIAGCTALSQWPQLNARIPMAVFGNLLSHMYAHHFRSMSLMVQSLHATEQALQP